MKNCIITVFAVGIIALGLSGCTDIHAESLETAEKGLVAATANVASSFRTVVSTLAPGTVSAESLADVAYHVRLLPEEQGIHPPPPRYETIYSLSSTTESTAIEVFVPAGSSTSAGLDSASTDLFGCVEFAVTYADGSLRMSDVACPPWLAEWNPSGAREVDVRELTIERGGDVEWKIGD